MSHTSSSSSSSSMPTLKRDPSMQELEKKVAAYVRRDVYGTMGRGELPWPEKVLLGLAMITLLPLRVALSIALMLLYYLICWVCTLFLDKNLMDFSRLSGWRRIVIVTSARFLSRCLFFVFGFYSIKEIYPKVECNNQPDQELKRPGAIVSNHVSYIDILYHIYAFFPTFVAKRSVSNLPLVGLMRDCLGCVYVERDSKSSEFKSASVTINERVLEAQQNKDIPMIMLFPEGTTTNGDYLLPFKTGAFLPKAPVLPVILRYPYERFSPAWDTISPVRHMILLLCQFKNHLEVKRLPVYYPSQQEKDDPKLYADNVRRLMAREGNLKMTDIGLAEKWVYHAAVGNARVPTVLHHKDE